jgi:hypothetical protein
VAQLVRSNRTSPQVKSQLVTSKRPYYSDMTAWRLRSHPILDGGQGEKPVCPDPSYPVPFTCVEPSGSAGEQIPIAHTIKPATPASRRIAPANAVFRRIAPANAVLHKIPADAVLQKRPLLEAVNLPSKGTILPLTLPSCPEPHTLKLNALSNGRVHLGLPTASQHPSQSNDRLSDVPQHTRNDDNGLQPPTLNSAAPVTGLSTPRLRIENKR